MKTRTYWLSLLVVGLLLVAGWTGSAQRQGQQTVQWEYMSIGDNSSKFNGDRTLNELGAQGWELISVAAFSGSENTTGGTVFYFKRIKK